MIRVCVFQDWIFDLTMQMQSVLVIAGRGPDGIGKFHPCKEITTRYRACVFKAAVHGRALKLGEGEDIQNTTFMTMRGFEDRIAWGAMCRTYFDHVDSLPHHYHLHLMHGAEIIAYKHPDKLFRDQWSLFYKWACQDMHLGEETEEELDRRLNDWDQVYWSKI